MEDLKVGTEIKIKMKIVAIIEDESGKHFRAQVVNAKSYDPSVEVKEKDLV